MTMKICYHEYAIYNAVMSSNTVSLTTARFVHKHIVGSLQNVHLPCTTYQISYNLLKIFIQLVADCGRKLIKEKRIFVLQGLRPFTFWARFAILFLLSGSFIKGNIGTSWTFLAIYPNVGENIWIKTTCGKNDTENLFLTIDDMKIICSVMVLSLYAFQIVICNLRSQSKNKATAMNKVGRITGAILHQYLLTKCFYYPHNMVSRGW